MSNTETIDDGLRTMGLEASVAQSQALDRHVALVYETNREMNLTAIPEAEAVSLHVLDSAAALPYLDRAPEGPYADLGSGAGFPGITLAILSGREVHLVESVRKKAAFLERAVTELCLKATVHPFRAEELAQQTPGTFAAVTARALSSLPSLVELAAPLLADGGHLICLKGRPAPDEIQRGDAAAGQCGMLRVSMDEISVPGVDGSRVIVVYRRSGRPRIKLPRRNGMAQRQPLA
jgi:16S rRNA (guanine527-N7)-methyltransferase